MATAAASEYPGLERVPWPDKDAPGRFVIRCSCRRWTATGTAAEISAASRGHDDSPGNRHVVSIAGRIRETS